MVKTLGISLITVMLLALAGVSVRYVSSTKVKSPVARQAINMVIDSDGPLFNTPESMCTVPLVSKFTLVSKKSSAWNTANGLLPANVVTPDQIATNGYRIYTPLKLTSLTPLLDRRTMPTQSFLVEGGTVNGDTIALDDAPSIKPANTYVGVYLPSARHGEVSFSESSLELREAFPITAQNEVVLQPRVIEQGQVSQEEVDIPYDTLVSDLAACKK